MSDLLLAQLSDPHVRADDDAAAAALARAVTAVLGLRPAPDAVLVSGDLADSAADAETARAAELLAPLPMPLHVMGGNHDDPAALRRYFPGLPGTGGEDVRWVAELGPLRLVACDTHVPGTDAGALGPERLAWLEARLAEQTERPTLLAMHHAPLLTGVRGMDALALAPDDRSAVADLLRRYPQVVRVVGGHVHRAGFAVTGGCPVFTAPSTHRQLLLDLRADNEGVALVEEPPGFALHRLADDGAITTLVVPVPGG